MGVIEVLTKERMLAIEGSSIISGHIDPGDGHLYLQRFDESIVDAGDIFPAVSLLLPEILDKVYPIGSIYVSISPTNPGTLFGGTWSAWGTGRTPVGVDTGQTEFNTVQKTGGSKVHTLTAAQSGLRSHNHTQNSHNHTQNSHNHTQNSHTHTPQGASGTAFIRTGGSTAWVGTSSGFAFETTTAATTAVNQATTAVNQATTATNNAVADADATEAHNNLQPYITCYFWRRTA